MYRTGNETLANLGSGTYAFAYLIGPLTMQMVAELLYRVVRLDYEMSITFELVSDPGVSITQSNAGTLTLHNSLFTGSIPDELEIFKVLRSSPDGTTIYPGQGLPFYEAATYGTNEMIPVSMEYDPDGPAIYKDDSGNENCYWLQGRLRIQDDGLGAVIFYCLNVPSGGSAVWNPFANGILSLASGSTSNLRYAVESFSTETVISADLSITAAEWHPYKNTAGDAAWNTSTGAHANGGPGA